MKPVWDAADKYADEKTAIMNLMARFRRHRLSPNPPEGLTAAEARALMVINHCNGHDAPARPGFIAHALQTTPSALSQIMKSLEAKGLIQRTRVNADCRGVQVTLTPQGKAYVDEADAALNARWTDLFDYLGEEDVKDLARILGRIAAYDDKVSASGGAHIAGVGVVSDCAGAAPADERMATPIDEEVRR